MQSDICSSDSGHAAAHAVARDDDLALPLPIVDVIIDHIEHWLLYSVPRAMETRMHLATVTPLYLFVISKVEVGFPVHFGLCTTEIYNDDVLLTGVGFFTRNSYKTCSTLFSLTSQINCQ